MVSSAKIYYHIYYCENNHKIPFIVQSIILVKKGQHSAKYCEQPDFLLEFMHVVYYLAAFL